MAGMGTLWRRLTAKRLPQQDEMESFGSDGEEAVFRTLVASFDTVVRNVVVPHKELYLEKDLMVVHRGVAFVIEVKNWKGEIGCDGRDFYQNKDNGVKKTLKSPVGTTEQFIKRMRAFYDLHAPICGMVVFCEPDCKLSLPDKMEDIALIKADKMVSYIKSYAREHGGKTAPLDPSRILHCTRFYSVESEFCKGMLADSFLDCETADGEQVQLDTACLLYLSVEGHNLRMRDKLRVTYTNGATDTFFNRDTVLTVACLDGSYEKIALHRLRHIVF